MAPWRHNARTCQFFRRLFDRLPVRISTLDLHHRILRKKIISELMTLECSFPFRPAGGDPGLDHLQEYFSTNCDASGLGSFVRRYLSTWNLTITSNFFRCTMYLVSHTVLCHCLVKQHSRNDKKKKEKRKKDCQMSLYHKADPCELIQ